METGHLPSLLVTIIPQFVCHSAILAWGDLTKGKRMWYNRVMMRRLALEKAKRLRELREAAGMTQVQLYLRSGVSQNTISLIENHGYVPSERVIERLVAVLGEEVRELFREEDF